MVKVDLLTKEELLYELKVRNEKSEPNALVTDLRKKLRKLLSEGTLPNHKYLQNTTSIDEELSVIKSKIEKCEEIVTELHAQSRPIDVARCENKIDHVNLRLELISKYKMSEEQKLSAVQFLKDLNKCKVQLEDLNFDREQINESVRKLSSSNMEEEELDLESVFVNVNKLSLEEKENVEMNVSVGDKSKPTQFDSELYQKLPNPMLEYFHCVKSCNGLVVEELLDFLKLMVKIQKETELSESVILKLLIPKTSDPLQSKLIENKNSSFREIREIVMKCFVPFGLKESLIRTHVNRVQGHNEPLALYVENIKMYSIILNCSYDEAELVEIMKMGINPRNRANLVFAGNPKTFRDMDDLCVQCQNVEYGNSLRKPWENVQDARSRNDAKRCYNCNKIGHLARQCRFRTNPKN